jgi:hypothetical protein
MEVTLWSSQVISSPSRPGSIATQPASSEPGFAQSLFTQPEETPAAYLQLRARFGSSLSNLAALLRQQLFVYRDLIAWIDEPFQPPPRLDPGAEQLALSW